MNDFYPLGTVVRLSGDKDYIMIVGRIVGNGEDMYDYAGVAFPIGVEGDDYFLFNEDEIEEVTFIGFQDERELVFSRAISEALDNISSEG